MTDTLTVFNRNYRNGVCYIGEHAKIMRMVYGIDNKVKAVILKQYLKNN